MKAGRVEIHVLIIYHYPTALCFIYLYLFYRKRLNYFLERPKGRPFTRWCDEIREYIQSLPRE